jgi:hypothetical protein
MACPRLSPTIRRSVAAILASLLIAQWGAPAWAWGRTGHRVIARLSERHLTVQARAEIKALLEPGESLADCSTWADEHRREMPKTAPWHYVDVPLDEPRYDDRFAGDEPGKGFIVPKIRELRVVLKDRSRPVEERRQTRRRSRPAGRLGPALLHPPRAPEDCGDPRDPGSPPRRRSLPLGGRCRSCWRIRPGRWGRRNSPPWATDLAQTPAQRPIAGIRQPYPMRLTPPILLHRLVD